MSSKLVDNLATPTVRFPTSDCRPLIAKVVSSDRALSLLLVLLLQFLLLLVVVLFLLLLLLTVILNVEFPCWAAAAMTAYISEVVVPGNKTLGVVVSSRMVG
jgi:hypothetical protein